MQIFNLQEAQNGQLPILLSVPHGGTYLPESIRMLLKPELLPPDDTDWWVDTLYEFAPAMGIAVISATHSRWVIDLNRNPESIPLYNDGRIITGLCTTTDFLGNPIYMDDRTELDSDEVQQRLDAYFLPYHQKVQDLLDGLKENFDQVLLWDCHSIRRVVSSIYHQPFPDLILGDADGTSAATAIIEAAMKSLSTSTYSLEHNHPFKGGYITRSFGKPIHGQHALQLEMTKTNYMDDTEKMYHPERARKMQELLKKTLKILSEKLLEQRGKNKQ